MRGKYDILDLFSKMLWIFFVPIVVIVTNPFLRFIVTTIGVITIIALIEIVRFVLLDERPLHEQLMSVIEEKDKNEKIKEGIKFAMIPLSSIVMILLLGHMLELFFVYIS